ncbi:reverse transcriptase [Tanacetum coccineum]
MFLVHLDHYVNFKRVLEDGPWSFKKNLVVLKPIEKDEQPTESNMSKVSFWIRFLNMPLSRRSKTWVRRIAAKLGDVMDVDDTYFENRIWGEQTQFYVDICNSQNHIRNPEARLHGPHLNQVNVLGDGDMEAESNSGMIKSSDGQKFENDGFDSGNMDGNKNTVQKKSFSGAKMDENNKNVAAQKNLKPNKTTTMSPSQLKTMGQDRLNNNSGIIVDPNYDTKENQSELNVGTNQPKTWKRRARERVGNSLNSGTTGDIHGGKRTYEDCNGVGDIDVDILCHAPLRAETRGAAFRRHRIRYKIIPYSITKNLGYNIS